ncbi:MAG: dienelactone hydrolase family protein [Methanosarcinales archaeon]|nr:dienelactone hydrolase family protein [Methanosarcinales archaeon]
MDIMDIGVTTAAKSIDGNDTVREVVFNSRNSEVSGLIRIPALSNGGQVPGAVILPGATVNKEGEQALARALSRMGYASIVIDQRNLAIIDHDWDMQMFLEGQEPVQHLSVYDALAATHVIRNEPGVDPSKIAMIGISNGGRFAIIATALDPTIAGVVGISTSGYDVNSMAWNIQDASAIRFLRSIDPDTYFADISSRPVVFLHSQNDTTIPLMLAQRTYNKAYEPKELIVINGSRHGFDESMTAPLQKELGIIFKN